MRSCFIFVITGRQAGEQRDPTHWIGDQCESACRTSASWLNRKSVIRGRCYLREKFEFPVAIHLETFLLFMCFTVFCFLNKLFNFTWRTFLLESLLCVYGSNRCISPGGIIPSEKASHLVENPVWDLQWFQSLSLL